MDAYELPRAKSLLDQERLVAMRRRSERIRLITTNLEKIVHVCQNYDRASFALMDIEDLAKEALYGRDPDTGGTTRGQQESVAEPRNVG